MKAATAADDGLKQKPAPSTEGKRAVITPPRCLQRVRVLRADVGEPFRETSQLRVLHLFGRLFCPLVAVPEAAKEEERQKKQDVIESVLIEKLNAARNTHGDKHPDTLKRLLDLSRYYLSGAADTAYSIAAANIRDH